MNKEEKANHQASEIIKFIRDKNIQGEFKVNHYTIILNMENFLSTQEERLKAYEVLSRNWKIIYMRLFQVKSALTDIK